MAVQRRPNVLFILLDNVGYGDPGCYGGGELRMAPTPRIDALAAEGLRLTNFNVEAECTPTRAAIMTGRMPIRTGCHLAAHGGHYGLAPWEFTMSQMFKDAGYATACFGKWHLGPGDRHPTMFGFDRWYGVQDSSDPVYDAMTVGHEGVSREPKIWEGNGGAPGRPVADYDQHTRPLIDEWVTERAVAFVREQAATDVPFFCYVPFTRVHHPALPHPDFAGRSGNGAYADTMLEVDHRTGQLLDVIDELGLREDTIVVWASDNGPPAHGTLGPQGDPGPFRGCLGTAYEGQLRVPCLVRWPGVTQPGRVSNEMVSCMDFFATWARLLGATLPSDRVYDAMDMTEFFAGDAPSPRTWLLCFIGQRLAAVKYRQFKMHFVEYGTEPGRRYKWDLAFPQMYNVASDPKEEWDILATNLWMSKVVEEVLTTYVVSVFEHPNIAPGGERPDPAVGAGIIGVR